MSLRHPTILCILVILVSQVMGCINAQVQHDDALASAVTTALLASDELNLSRVEAHAESGVVNLSGMADDHESKAHAETEARKVPGVKSIISKIEVDF
jgi:osmotically-inducible protein OsmY